MPACWVTVHFPRGVIAGHTEECRACLGAADFHAHAELQGYFWMKDKLKDECIII